MRLFRHSYKQLSDCIRRQLSMEQLPPGDPITRYRYFLPVQTRVADSVADPGMLFYQYADTIINNYLFWYCDFAAKLESGQAKHMMVHTEHNFRSKTNYPQVLLGAARVERLGNSSVRYGVAFFRPKLDYQSKIPAERIDALSKLQISLHGKIINKDSDILDKLQNNFHPEPCSFGKLVHSFLDNNDRPLKTLPGYIVAGMSDIFIPESTL